MPHTGSRYRERAIRIVVRPKITQKYTKAIAIGSMIVACMVNSLNSVRNDGNCAREFVDGFSQAVLGSPSCCNGRQSS